MGSPDLQHSKSSSSSGSSSGSTAKTSPPSSPDNEPDGLQRPPRPTAHYSSTPPRRGNRHAVHTPPATHRLGVIDEDSPRVAPDIPTRHPDRPRKTVAFLPVDAKRLFSFSAYARPGEDVPPPDVYEKITGPRGEKFEDLRRNRPYHPPGRGGGWRRMVCLGCVAFVILVVLGIALGVGLGVGLTKRKGASSQPVSTDPVPADNTTSPSSNNQNYPLGTFAIPTYLTTTNTSCTSNPATWRCYPYTTYSQSTTASFSTLLWRITSPTNSTLDLQISNTNPAFSYPFTNVPLTLSNAGDLQQSAFTFSFNFRKQVIPDADITGGDNAATRCYYNNTLVSVRLYDNAQGGGGNVTRPPSGQSDTQNGGGELWPYAIEFEERIAEPPECFRYVNGEEGAVVPVDEGVGECVCGYRNFGL
ncbi:hypothetical protein LTR64_008232 [Lithohypha guttulata]|uniref:uncharacterized protein n=1 Tax=Lithohypha guttulata TaxID=1690604 RepID=UPI002DE1B6B5|nr:hypothetical protein LTR51_008384 [Lithohypha guttulata]